jgi:predicted enzyme related to lactoylglutathione lyase
MKRVVHFEISTDDPERAANFYRNVFGWKIEKWEPPIDYWLVTTGEDTEPGINGGIKRRSDPAVGTVNTIDVPSIDDIIAKIESGGGKVVMPKTEIPGVGFHAYCQDSEGNVFGLMEGGPSGE